MNELNADDIRRLATVNRSRVNIRVTKVFSPTAGGRGRHRTKFGCDVIPYGRM